MSAEQSQQNPLAPAGDRVGRAQLSRGLGLGVVGSIAGTLAMDLVMIGEFSIMGWPAGTQLDLIGSVFGGGMALGVVLHTAMGVVLGLLFGIAVTTIDMFRIRSTGRGVTLGILAGIITIPFGCVPFAIVSGVPIARMVSFSTVPHLVWGVLLGIVAGYGLRSPE